MVLGRLLAIGPLEWIGYYVKITALRVFSVTFSFPLFLFNTEAGLNLPAWIYIPLCLIFAAILFLATKIPSRLRWILLYLVFVPHLAALYFYSTKSGMALDQLLFKVVNGAAGGGERYFYAGIATVGVIALTGLQKRNTRTIALILSAGLAAAVIHGYPVPRDSDYGYYNWQPQADCLQGLRDGNRGTCWLTFYGGGWNGWKRSVTAPFDSQKLAPLGVTDLVDYEIGRDIATGSFVLTLITRRANLFAIYDRNPIAIVPCTRPVKIRLPNAIVRIA